MGWGDVISKLVTSIPIFGPLFGIVGDAIGGPIAKALGVSNDPDTVLQAIEKDPDALKKLQVISKEILGSQEIVKNEIASNDKFVRHARPTMTYIISFTWALQMLIISIVVLIVGLRDPSYFLNMVDAIGNFFSAESWMWMAAFALVGVNVKMRSNDKILEKTGRPAEGIATIISKAMAK